MKLRDYQTEISAKAANLLHTKKIAYLAMEVRTGKTITALETCRVYGARNVLFVTKKKAISSIKADATNFPTLFVEVINYESVHKGQSDPDVIICDEAHCLGAFPKPSERTNELKKIAAGKPIIFLSGTPSPESYSQLYHQMYVSSFSPWNHYTNFYKWANDYVIKKTKFVFNRQINDYSTARKEKIDNDIKPLFLTYTQQQAGFDVTIQEEVLTVPMPKIMGYIDRLRKDLVLTDKKSGEPVVIADTAVKLMGKIQQLCGGTVLGENGKMYLIDHSKANFIKSHFIGKKIAIFYKFKAEFELLKAVFPTWTNSPDEFQTSTDKVYLGQFVSSREGVRLDTADALIFYNIDFSFLSYEQARNRIISKERTTPAVLYWMFAENGIESKIYEAVKNKQDYTTSYFQKDYGKIRKPHTA